MIVIRRSILLSLCWVVVGFYLSPPARSQSKGQFYCEQSTTDENAPTLYFRVNKTRTVPLLTWKYQEIAVKKDPQLYRQCEIAITNFQRATKEGQLQYFTTAVGKEQHLICGSRSSTTPCDPKTQLFSVLPSQQPTPILGKLTKAFQGKTISPIIIVFKKTKIQGDLRRETAGDQSNGIEMRPRNLDLQIHVPQQNPRGD
jgi:Circadian oscillating protein COP23